MCANASIFRNILLDLCPRSGPVARLRFSASAQGPFIFAVPFIQPHAFPQGPPHGRPERILFAVIMSLDPAKFLHHLERFDLTEAQKVELIHSLEWMMECYLDWLLDGTSEDMPLDWLKGADSDGAADAIESDCSALVEPFERAALAEPGERGAESD